MKKSKALLLALCAAALSVGVTFGTLAYLTDTEAVTNTFTVGQVHISLDEADVDDTDKDGNTTERDKTNEYHLIPGHSYIKDPTVHVADNSESAWLFVEVNNGIADIEAATVVDGYTSIADQIAAKGWKVLDAEEYPGVYYHQYTKGGEKNFVVFEEFKIDGDKTVNVPADETVPDGKFDIADYEGKLVTITAYAIQLPGFEDKPVDAWNALQTQLAANS